MALVGLAGREGTARHADATAMALNEMNPRFINLLTYLRPMPAVLLSVWPTIRDGRAHPSAVAARLPDEG